MDPSDIPGIGEVVNKTYDDAVAPAAKRTGELAADGMDAAHRLLHPLFDLVRHGGDRLQKLVDRAAANVPIERQQPAPTNIAGPILWNLYFAVDGSDLQAMYLRLLQAAIDRDMQGKAHPAYIRTIEVLSPLDAAFLKHIYEQVIVSKVYPYSNGKLKPNRLTLLNDLKGLFPVDDILILISALDHLESLGLVSFGDGFPQTVADEMTWVRAGNDVELSLYTTAWGICFCDVCLPPSNTTEPKMGD